MPRLPATYLPILRRLGFVGFVMTATLFLFGPTDKVAAPTLDVSNYISYAHFTASGTQYGGEVLPMVGPYGFALYGEYYGGELFWIRLILEGAILIGFSSLLYWFTGRIRGWGWRVLWLGVLFTHMAAIGDAAFDISVLMAGLFLILSERKTKRDRWCLAAVSILLALLALFKGTQLSFSILVVGLFTLDTARHRQWSAMRTVVITFIAALLGWWLLAGQNPLNLPRYVRGILELSSGYNATMGLQEPRLAFLTGATALIALAVAIGGLALAAGFNSRLWVAAVLAAAFSFISWKHGFVRADGHMLIFYRYAGLEAALILALATQLPALTGWRRGVRWGLVAPTALAFGLGLYGTGVNVVQTWQWEWTHFTGLWGKHTDFLTNVTEHKTALDAKLATNRTAFRLHRLQHRIGHASVDYFGADHGFLLLNDLNYQPRPMGGGSFNVFTPWLQDQNQAFIRDSTRAPRFYMVNLQAIDQRLTSQEDGPALLALLQHYRPVDTERGMLLFERRPAPIVSPTPRFLEQKSLTFDGWVDVPAVADNELLLVEFALPMNTAGKARKFLYKPPMIYAHVEGSGRIIQDEYLRLLPSMLTRPVLLTPMVEKNADLLSCYLGEKGKSIRRLKLASPLEDQWRESDFNVRFYSMPRPTAPTAVIEDLRHRLKFPVTSEPPRELVPANAGLRSFDGLLVRMVDPPGHYEFDLQGDERTVSFGFGMDDDSWQNGGNTDGVTFRVEMHDGDGGVFHVFRRDLLPRDVPADRGLHHAVVGLPARIPPGSTLRISTGFGPNNNGAWDWAYLTNIWLYSGPYEALQFPGFSTLPVSVGEGNTTPYHGEGRPAILLNAPGELVFALDSTFSQMQFSGALVAGAYTDGQTDGIDYVAEIVSPAGEVTEFWREQLRPLTRPEDRGWTEFKTMLPAFKFGDRLRIRTDPGPAGNGAWDWALITGFQLQ